MKSASRKKKKAAGHSNGNHSGSLGVHVREVMQKYFSDMDGHQPTEVYELILSQIEIPLFESVLDYTGGNVSRAAEILGLNRGTFRNRLRKYDMQ
jgi:Fis family transcriptional regulator